MKKILPRLTMMSLILLLTSGAIMISSSGCTNSKPACGNKHDHKVRKQKMKRMAPNMTN